MNSRHSLPLSTRATQDFPAASLPGRTHRRHERSLGAFVSAGLVAALALAGCGNTDKQQAGGPGGPGGPGGQAMPVTVIDVQAQRVPITVDAVGQSEGSKEVQVRARVSGILIRSSTRVH